MSELTCSAGAKNRSSNCATRSRGLEADVDLEEPLQAPCFEIAGADEHMLAVGDERLRMQHLRIAQNLYACLDQPLVVELLGRTARPVVRVRGHEQAHAGAATCRRTIRPIMPRSVTYGFTTSSVSCAPSMSVAIAAVIGLNRPGALWSTTAGDGARALVELRKELRDARASESRRRASAGSQRTRAAAARRQGPRRGRTGRGTRRSRSDPRFRHHRPSRSDRRRRPPCGGRCVPAHSGSSRRPRRRPEAPWYARALSRGSTHTWIPASRQPLVELPRAALGVGALPIHDQPDGDALLRLGDRAQPRTDRPPDRDGNRTG